MVWVDRILTVSHTHGLTEVTLNRALMLQGGRVHVGAIIEFLAQSYGYIMAVLALQQNQRVRLAQLAAIDKFELLLRPLPAVGETLTAELITVSQSPSPLSRQGSRIHVYEPRAMCHGLQGICAIRNRERLK